MKNVYVHIGEDVMKYTIHKLLKYIKERKAVCLVFCLLAAAFLVYSYTVEDKSFAEEGITIELDGAEVDPSERIQMTTSSITLTLRSSDNIYSDASKYAINWTLESESHRKRAKIENGTSSIYGVLTALEPGEVQIMVNVVDKSSEEMGIVASASCWVDIIFTIDTTIDDSHFKFLYDDDANRSLVMYSDSEPYPLNLAFGTVENCQWSTENDEVVEIDADHGIVTPVGAGTTNIIATYTPTGDTQTYTAYLPVYIFPKISLDGDEFFTGGTKGMATGDTIYTDAFFGALNTESIQEKVDWVIKKDIDGVRTVIEDSKGNKTSDLITIAPVGAVSNTPNLEIVAKAGNYYIEFYPYGAYQSESRKTSISPTVLNLTVYAEFENYDKTILVNDAFNIAEAFNMTVDDFTNLFSRPYISLLGGADSSNYVSYDSVSTVVTAIQKGVVSITVAGKTGKESLIGNLCNPNKLSPTTTFELTLRIIDSFTLDRTSVVITKGNSLQLTPTFTSYSGKVTWSTSDDKYVKVNEGGYITAIKETTEGHDVTITATLELDDGTIKRAFCVVKVRSAIGDIGIDKTTLELQKGDTQTLIAKFSGNVTVAPFTWDSTDPKVCSVTPAADGKSCLVRGEAGGTATIVLTNTDNNRKAYCKVKVLIPIEKIELTETEKTAKLYTVAAKMKYTIQPTNATETELIWKSSDEKVATVDATGLVTYVGPGTTLISVSPAVNPYSTYSQCILTVIKTADSMLLSATEVTLYTGDTYTLGYSVEPENSELAVNYSSADPAIAAVDNLTGIITAKKAGSTQIFVQGEGLNAPSVCNVKVLQSSTGISFASKEIIVRTGETATAHYNIKPADSTDEVTWMSLDTKVATVKDGVVTGVAPGSTYVQVKTTSGEDAIVPVYVRDPVKGLALDKTETTMTVGEKLTLVKIFTPANPYDQSVKWTTTNGGVAVVNNDGVVTATGGGIAVIKCTANDGGYQATCIVTVKEAVASISLNHTSYNLGLGKTVKLVATISNSKATDKSVTWSTSNSKIATVNQNGKVKGKKIGKCTITAKANDGSGMQASCAIRVVRQVKSLKLNKKTARILVGETVKLKKTVKPANASIKSVSWSSSDEGIATVDNKGLVLGVAPGIVKIKATAKDGSRKTASCLVTVRENIASVGIKPVRNEITIAVNTSENVGFEMSPADSTDTIKYVSDNKSVATVNKKGKIYGKSIGSATIYATTSSGYSATVDVNVVGLNRTSVSLRQYDKETVWVNGFDKNVKWFSQNPLVATVQNGKIVGRKAGTTRIYAVVDGTRITCNVRVSNIK